MLKYFYLMEKNRTIKYLQKGFVITHVYKLTQKILLKGIPIGI